MGPDYHAPDVKVPEHWTDVPQDEETWDSQYEQRLSSWWSNLNDPMLTDLIQKALERNNDLRTAVARVREVRARLGISRAGQHPTLDASASARRSRNNTKSEGQTTTSETDSFSVGLDAAWEIDLFGGTRRAIEAATADLSASEESLRDVQVTVVSEVALTYITIREFQSRIGITIESLSALREEADIARIRKESGLTSDLDLFQAEEALASTEAQLPSLYAGMNESLNNMAILLGMHPGTLHEQFSAPAPIPSPPSGIETGVPADLLRRRPDIRRAERELAAETARVGVATSELYPKFSLTGSFVYEELTADIEGTTTTTKRQTTGFAPTLSWPVYRAGAIRRNIEVQDARQEQALIAYEQTVLTALGDVENALRSYRETDQQTALLRRAVIAAMEAEKLQNILYQSGLDDFESLLTARKNLLSLQDRLASSEASMVSELIRLYKALGGGWVTGSNKSEANAPQS